MSFEREFTTIRDLGPDYFSLRGTSLLVEMIEPEEIKTKSGLYIPIVQKQVGGGSVQAHKLEYGRVLLTGPGEYNPDTQSYDALDIKPGFVVILPQHSQQYISTFPGLERPTENKLAIVSARAVFGYYTSQEAFDLVKEKINK